jgi:ribulose-5-phosphate 4-epimerase/fuculose-1-phosphate aldolase
MMMGQHGILVVGPSIAQAFDDIYYFERSAELFMTALATGQELNVATPEIAEKTAQEWAEYPNFANKHLAAIRAVLDDEEPDYRK